MKYLFPALPFQSVCLYPWKQSLESSLLKGPMSHSLSFDWSIWFIVIYSNYWYFITCFLVVFVVLLCSFFLLFSSFVILLFSLRLCLRSLCVCVCVCVCVCIYCTFLTCGYHRVPKCWPVIISTCFKLVVVYTQTQSKRSTFLLLYLTFCVFDVIFYIFMLIPWLFTIVKVALTIFCLLIYTLAYLIDWSSLLTIYLPFLVRFFSLSYRFLFLFHWEKTLHHFSIDEFL